MGCHPIIARSATRYGNNPDDRLDDIGFRVWWLSGFTRPVQPTARSILWRGFATFTDYRKVKVRNVHHAIRRLGQRYETYCTSQISFAQRDASVQGWINHVRFAYSWGLSPASAGDFRRSLAIFPPAKSTGHEVADQGVFDPGAGEHRPENLPEHRLMALSANSKPALKCPARQ